MVCCGTARELIIYEYTSGTMARQIAIDNEIGETVKNVAKANRL